MNQSSPALFVSQAYSFVCRNHLWLPDGRKFVVKELPSKCDQLQAIYQQMRPSAKLISIKKAIARLGFRRKESKEGEIVYFHDPDFYVWKCPWTFSRSNPPDLDFVSPKPRQDEYLRKKKDGSHSVKKTSLNLASPVGSESSNTSTTAALFVEPNVLSFAGAGNSRTSPARSPPISTTTTSILFSNNHSHNHSGHYSIASNNSPLFAESSFQLDSHFASPSPTNCSFVPPILLAGEGKASDEELLFLSQDPALCQPIRFDNSSPGSLAVAAATAVAMSQPKLPAGFLNQNFQFQVPLAPQHQALTNFHSGIPSTNPAMYSSAPKTDPIAAAAATALPPSSNFYPLNFFGGNSVSLPETGHFSSSNNNNNNNNGTSSPEQSNISLVGGETCSLNQPPLPSFSPFDNFYGNSISQYFFGPPQCDDEFSRFLSDLENSISN